MADSVEFDQGRLFAQLFSSLDELFGLRDRDYTVGRSVDQYLSSSVGEKFDRAASVVSICMLVGSSAHELCNYAVSQPMLPRCAKVAHAGDRNRCADAVLLTAV